MQYQKNLTPLKPGKQETGAVKGASYIFYCIHHLVIVGAILGMTKLNPKSDELYRYTIHLTFRVPVSYSPDFQGTSFLFTWLQGCKLHFILPLAFRVYLFTQLQGCKLHFILYSPPCPSFGYFGNDKVKSKSQMNYICILFT